MSAKCPNVGYSSHATAFLKADVDLINLEGPRFEQSGTASFQPCDIEEYLRSDDLIPERTIQVADFKRRLTETREGVFRDWSLRGAHSQGYRFGMASKPLRDSDVRQAAYRRLLTHAQACPDTLVIDELGLDHGSCRIDIAVINSCPPSAPMAQI